jgi:site-specific DNA recombinase
MRNDWLGDNRNGMAIIRVSSRRQEGNISHETQEQEIRAYCERSGILLKEVVRIVESAKNSDDRKKYTRAINAALTQNIRHLLFYMYDREARNLTDNEKNEKLVKADLICLHYVRENKILSKDSPDSEFFIRDVQAAANKQFIRNLSAKVGDSMKQKAEQGWYPSNNPPLGYAPIKMKDENGRELRRGSIVGIDPDPKRVRQVQREFELRAQGRTYREIRQIIISEGFIDPSKVHRYREGALEYRLKLPFYEGRFTWQGVEYHGKHPLIIPPERLAAVRRINAGLRLVRRTLDADHHGSLGGGWIRCICGCAIVYDPKKKVLKRSGETIVFHYYRCSNRKGLHASLRGMNIREESLWEQLGRAVDSIQLSPALAHALAQELNESQRTIVAANAKKIAGLKAELGDLERREDEAYDNLVRKVIDEEAYRRAVLRIRQRRVDVRHEMDQAQAQSIGGFRETAETVFELAKNAKSLFISRSPLERRTFLEMICSNPVLNGATVEYVLKKPFSTLAEINTSGEWRTRLGEVLTGIAALQGENFLGKQRFSQEA